MKLLGFICSWVVMLCLFRVQCSAEIARRLGCPQHLVSDRRRRLKVSAFRRMPPRRNWTPSEDKLLGTMPDQELAKRLGRTLNAIRTRREQARIPVVSRYVFWDDKQIALLGKMHDKEVAALTGHAIDSVAIKRRQLGIKLVDPILPAMDSKGRCFARYGNRQNYCTATWSPSRGRGRTPPKTRHLFPFQATPQLDTRGRGALGNRAGF